MTKNKYFETPLQLQMKETKDRNTTIVSVTRNNIKICPILINIEFMLFIRSLLNSMNLYYNLNLEFCNTFLWHRTQGPWRMMDPLMNEE